MALHLPPARAVDVNRPESINHDTYGTTSSSKIYAGIVTNVTGNVSECRVRVRETANDGQSDELVAALFNPPFQSSIVERIDARMTSHKSMLVKASRKNANYVQIIPNIDGIATAYSSR